MPHRYAGDILLPLFSHKQPPYSHVDNDSRGSRNLDGNRIIPLTDAMPVEPGLLLSLPVSNQSARAQNILFKSQAIDARWLLLCAR
jgi:hypothetical protein